jgi:7-carboxy-7-deazaguanine synthase
VINLQMSEPTRREADGSMEVVGVWDTIQGEGPYAGERAVFVRLAGCNLECPFCDTDYTTGRKKFTPAQLVQAVRGIRAPNEKACAGMSLVVVTGGEPFRQNLAPFVNQLLAAGYFVQLETNGMLYCAGVEYEHERLSIVCSPKGPGIHPNLLPYINAFKYVLQAGHVADDGLPSSVLGNDFRVYRPEDLHWYEIYVQPLDTGIENDNRRNLAATIASCRQHGYRLCLQLHKIIGVE